MYLTGHRTGTNTNFKETNMNIKPEFYTLFTFLADAQRAVEGTYLTADHLYDVLDHMNPKYLVRYVVSHNGIETPAMEWMQLYRQDNDLR